MTIYSRDIELVLYSYDVQFMVDYISPLLASDNRWSTICRACSREMGERGAVDEDMRRLIYSQFELLFEPPWQLGD